MRLDNFNISQHCSLLVLFLTPISGLYHGFMKAALRISIKDFRRNKNLKSSLLPFERTGCVPASAANQTIADYTFERSEPNFATQKTRPLTEGNRRAKCFVCTSSLLQRRIAGVKSGRVVYPLCGAPQSERTKRFIRTSHAHFLCKDTCGFLICEGNVDQ